MVTSTVWTSDQKSGVELNCIGSHAGRTTRYTSNFTNAAA